MAVSLVNSGAASEATGRACSATTERTTLLTLGRVPPSRTSMKGDLYASTSAILPTIRLASLAAKSAASAGVIQSGISFLFVSAETVSKLRHHRFQFVPPILKKNRFST